MRTAAEPSPGFGLPRANTGSAVLDRLNGVLISLVHLERRIDPFIRPGLDALLRDPLTRLTTSLVNLRRRDEGFGLAE